MHVCARAVNDTPYQLLALLKMKQARAKTQKAAPPQPRVASPRAAQSRPSMLVVRYDRNLVQSLRRDSFPQAES